MKSGITMDRLISQMAAIKCSSSGQTLKEIVGASGLCEKRVLRLLHDAKRNGMITVRRELRERLDGGMASVPVYIVNEKAGMLNGDTVR